MQITATSRSTKRRTKSPAPLTTEALDDADRSERAYVERDEGNWMSAGIAPDARSIDVLIPRTVADALERAAAASGLPVPENSSAYVEPRCAA